MSSPFDKPGQMSDFDQKAHNGSLVIVEPLAHHPDMATRHGETNAMDANVIVITSAEGDGDKYENVRLFGKVLCGTNLNSTHIGSKVLGRLSKSDDVIDGKSAPWMLLDPSDGDVEAATKYLNKLSSPGGSTPAATNSAPEAPF